MIDDMIREEWPEPVRAACAAFKQGDLVDQPPFFYYAGPEELSVWGRDLREQDAGPEIVAVEAPERIPYGIITSQTCDIDEYRPSTPWVQISPVVAAASCLKPEDFYLLERHRVVHLMKLTSPALQPDLWVADLRHSVPVEKSWLVGRTPIAGFATEDGYLEFQQHASMRLARPALAENIIRLVTNPLRARFGSLKGEKKEYIIAQVEEVYLRVGGPRLEPRSAQLIVLTLESPPQQGVREWFDTWSKKVNKKLTEDNIPLSLLATAYTTADLFTRAQERRAIRLDFAYLCPDPRSIPALAQPDDES